MGDDAAPPFPGVAVEYDVTCRLPDGTTLRADVYRPESGDSHPVLLQRTPYNKRVAGSQLAYAHPSWYARQGFLVVVQDCRGRGRSEGNFYPFRHEAADGAATVEWAARLPGSDGRVAMYGSSYAGMTQLLAAREQPEGLRAICPAMVGSEPYDGWAYSRGALALSFVVEWAGMLARDDARRRGDVARTERLRRMVDAAEIPLRAADHELYGDPETSFFRDWVDHSTRDDYWAPWAICNSYDAIDVAGLHLGGWYDIFLAGTVAHYRALREVGAAPQKLVVGPYVHTRCTPLDGLDGTAGPNRIDDVQVAWLRHALDGVASPHAAAPVTVHVPGKGWTDLPTWPPDVEHEVLYLRSDGRANTRFGDGRLEPGPPGDEPPDVYIYDPIFPEPSAGGHSCCQPCVTGPADQASREASKGVLVYTSAPVTASMTLLGEPEVTLYASTSAPDTDFAVRLCAVDERGRSVNLQEAVVRASFRDSLDEPRVLERNAVHRYVLPLGPVAARIPAGGRLRLQVTSSDFPMWEPNSNRGPRRDGEEIATQRVFHDSLRASCVSIPNLV